MNSPECTNCRRTEKDAKLRRCECCSADVCVRCIEQNDSSDFEILRPLIEGGSLKEVDAKIYSRAVCPECLEVTIAQLKEKATDLILRGQNVHYWPVSYRGLVPVLRKSREWVAVTDARDSKEALLLMGILAAQSGFNAMVSGEIERRKVRNEGYQKMLWNAKAHPVDVDPGRVEWLERFE